MGENTLRALASALAYLEGWAKAATGAPLPWPAPESLALKYVAHHLWDPSARETDPQHGMPAEVAAELLAKGEAYRCYLTQDELAAMRACDCLAPAGEPPAKARP